MNDNKVWAPIKTYRFGVDMSCVFEVEAGNAADAEELLALHVENLPTDLYLRPHVRLMSIDKSPFSGPTLLMIDNTQVPDIGIATDFVSEAAETLAEVQHRHGAL